MVSIFERQRIGKYLFLAISSLTVIVFLLVSSGLIKELAQQERERMDIWAQATQRLANSDVNSDVEFLLGIISQNNSIPVLVTDTAYNILDYRNFRFPDKGDEGVAVGSPNEKNRQWLTEKVRKAAGGRPLAKAVRNNPHFIEVEVSEGNTQYIYYEDSILLKRLSLYPYIQLIVMIALGVIIYVAVVYTKRSEQNRVWAGLSKETAHQLGTPISSLMAWTQFLEASGVDADVTSEINKDVERLHVIADRFSKIGSMPEVQLEYLNEAVEKSLGYMQSRVSGKVVFVKALSEEDHGVWLSLSLFEWVMENLVKNAVDAMAGEGTITISTGADRNRLWIEVADTGKGISRKNFKNVFNPGFTTKKRGWGLGLTLVKRIIEDYHGGRIYVKDSEPGRGTTFRIEIPEAR